MPATVVHSRPASLRPEDCAEVCLPVLDAPLRLIPLGAVMLSAGFPSPAADQ